MNKAEWTQAEDDLIRRHYPEIGAGKMRSRGMLANRTRKAIGARAYRLGIENTSHAEAMDAAELLWPIPAYELTDADRAFQSWRGPVNRAPLRGMA